MGETRHRPDEPVTTLDYRDLLLLQPTDNPTWPEVFAHIAANHVAFAPDYWDRFVVDVARRGVVTPVVVSDGKVWSGHHRVWAAAQLRLGSVPVVRTHRPHAWTWIQGRREGDWLPQT